MNFNLKSLPQLIIFLMLCIFHFSCSKDSDLLADLVLVDANQVILVDDIFVVSLNGSTVLDVLSNDNIGTENNVTITETSEPANGTIEINPDNTLTYTPEDSVIEEPITDTFTYTVESVNNDQAITTQEGSVTVTQRDGDLKAFPSVVGNGSYTVGGRGKALAIVNTLDWDASLVYHKATGDTDEYYVGGLGRALQEPDVGYIVFNLSGYINLGNSGTGTSYSGVYGKTVFGQSAPKGGITLTGGAFRLNSSNMNDCDELIFRFIRSRPRLNQFGIFDPSDDDAWTWAFLTEGGDNVVFDHCSASFASDKLMGSFLSDNKHDGTGITLSNHTWSHNLIADGGTGMVVGTNPEDPWDQMDDVTHYRNVFVSVNRTPNLNLGGEVEHINNIVYDAPDKLSRVFNETHINHIGNFYKKTNNNANEFNTNSISGQNDPQVYSAYNFYQGTVGGSFIDYNGTEADNSGMWENYNSGTTADSKYFKDTKHTAMTAMVAVEDIGTPQEAYNDLIKNGNVGAYQYLNDDGAVKTFRDSFDTTMISYVANNTNYTNKQPANWVLPVLPKNTRPSSYDTDNDGMSDAWETSVFGDLSESYRGDFDGDGYENIEEYMNQVDFN